MLVSGMLRKKAVYAEVTACLPKRRQAGTAGGCGAFFAHLPDTC